MSAATSPTVASTTTPSTSRARRDSSDSRRSMSLVFRRFEHVARLPHRLDHGRPEPVELAAEVAHVGLDHVRVAAEVVAPDVLEDLRLREHTSRIEHEEPEQGELGPCE